MDTWFERLNTLDSLFLELEDRSTHMHVGAIAVFEGKPPPYRDLLALIEARLDQVPRYRQRVVFVPFKQGRPVWVDESQFDLEYHVRHTALPPPGGEDELKKLAGRLLSQQLDRDKPLWELWLVEGLVAKDGREQFALVSKTHHCMLDGISGVDLATVLLDTEPSTNPPPKPAEWHPRPAPTSAELLVDSVREQVTHPWQIVQEAIESNGEARKLLREIGSGLKAVLGLAGIGFAPPSAMNHPIGPHRRFETLELPLPEIKKIRQALRGTTNDVLLTVVAGGLRQWLTARGETLGPDLRVLVPVSMRSRSARGTFGNQISAVFCPLPVAEPNPVERLRKVRDSMKGLKENGQAVGAQTLTRLGDFAPPTLLAQAARLQSMTRFFNLVVTNVPGPQFPLYLLGRRMEACFPQVPLAAQQTVGIAMLSYHGRVDIGLLADLAVRDLPALASAMRGALDELLGASAENIGASASGSADASTARAVQADGNGSGGREPPPPDAPPPSAADPVTRQSGI